MSLPELPAISVLTPFITRILGQNPGNFTLQGTNTYLIGHPSSREKVLLDTGGGEPAYSSLLKQYLQISGQRIAAIVLTHWHGDHVGGVDNVLSALGYNPPIHKYHNEDLNEPSSWQHVNDSDVLNYAGVRLEALHTPGHAEDHLCLWLEEERALFSADNVLGHGTSTFRDYGQYLQSLRRLHALPALGKIYPGHGQVIEDGPRKIAEYIKHRVDREKQVETVLRTFKEPVHSIDITKEIYGDVPDDVLAAADRGVRLYLSKMEQDGTAETTGLTWIAKSNL